MAAQPKPIPLRPADIDGELDRRPPARHEAEDRRRMNVSEKLAEGRGFWRGAFVGASIGVAGGIVASGGIAGMWTDQVLKTVQNSLLISGTLASNGASESADLVKRVHPEAPESTLPIPAAPNGSGDASH